MLGLRPRDLLALGTFFHGLQIRVICLLLPEAAELWPGCATEGSVVPGWSGLLGVWVFAVLGSYRGLNN